MCKVMGAEDRAPAYRSVGQLADRSVDGGMAAAGAP